MGSAVLTPASRSHSPAPAEAPAVPGSAEALRQQAAARIAAHRDRRQAVAARASSSSAEALSSGPSPDRIPSSSHKSRIASAVAERYAQAQSYRAFLAAEAERAVQQARAAAEIAARNAQAIADAQQQLLDTLAAEAAAQAAAAQAASQATAQPATETATHPASQIDSSPALWPDLKPAEAEAAAFSTTELAPDSPGALRVVLYEQIPPPPVDLHAARGRTPAAPLRPDPSDPEAWLLDEEISFRQAPVFEESAGPPTALPANLIEFPRQLFAARKARPRYAEGPLREDNPAAAGGSQLRIFEVEPAQIATAPTADLAAATEAQWSSLWLDTPTGKSVAPIGSDRHPAHIQEAAFLPASADLPVATAATQLYPARWNRRGLAAAIDLGITAVAALVFASAFATIAGHSATQAWDTRSLLAGAAASLHGLPVATAVEAITGTGIALSLAYQVLFFTFADSTPGMRLARLGLCTFADENPSRSAMRRRIPALVLSTLLFGIGFLWALLDEDGLPWHDLISRMYPRSY